MRATEHWPKYERNMLDVRNNNYFMFKKCGVDTRRSRFKSFLGTFQAVDTFIFRRRRFLKWSLVPGLVAYSETRRNLVNTARNFARRARHDRERGDEKSKLINCHNICIECVRWYVREAMFTLTNRIFVSFGKTTIQRHAATAISNTEQISRPQKYEFQTLN